MKRKPPEQMKSTTADAKHVHWNQLNRKQRREMMRKIQCPDLNLEVIHPNAAGIDIGNESHYIAVPPVRDSQPVRRFGCTTAELKAIADWLKHCGIRTVAMQLGARHIANSHDRTIRAGACAYTTGNRNAPPDPASRDLSGARPARFLLFRVRQVTRAFASSSESPHLSGMRFVRPAFPTRLQTGKRQQAAESSHDAPHVPHSITSST